MLADSNIINEISIENQPIPVDIKGTSLILNQMEKCICKIIKDNGQKGTGFFCKIPFPDNNHLLPFLITNYHILNEEDIENNKIINLIMYNEDEDKDEEKIIKIDDKRKKYSHLNEKEGIDITFIEIKPSKDNINDFLEFDDKILGLNCKKKSIYILHYPKEEKLASYGILSDIINGNQIAHYCNTEDGSSGSPILSLSTFKVIGVHYGGSKTNIKINYGTFIKNILREFNNKYQNFSIMNNNNFNNNYNINTNNINNTKNKNHINKIELMNINLTKEEYNGHDYPISKHEINNLLLKEKAMCIISYKNQNNFVYGSGFFVILNNNKYGLLTNNHIINNIEIGNTIQFYYLSNYRKIEITKDRKAYTNEKLNYTFIEIFKDDNIQDYFKIYSNNINNLRYHNIFILQYQKNELSFSYGKIQSIDNNEIRYNACTTYSSSGSPIILRSNDNLIIGLHCCKSFSHGGNLGTTLDSIISNIQQKECKINTNTFRNNNIIINLNKKTNNLIFKFNKDDKNKELDEFKNEINCIYYKKDKEPIYLLHDFKLYIDKWDNEHKKLYEEAKRNINKNNIEIYINNKIIKFNYKYESNEIRKIRVKFKFNKILTSIVFMFYECSSLESIDLTSFNTNNVNNMSYMFYGCSSLKSIDLTSFNTNNVINMSYMFYGCSSLKSIDLSSFNTNNVINMSCMFSGCSSLKSIDLSSFNTNNVTSMSHMFHRCISLRSLDLSSFNTNNVMHMDLIFNRCSSLKKQNVKLNKKEKKIFEEIP